MPHGYAVRLSGSGDTLWTAYYDSLHHLYAAECAPEGSFYLAGDRMTDVNHLAVSKVDDLGREIWSVRDTSTMPDSPFDAMVLALSNGCLAVTQTFDADHNGAILLLRLDDDSHTLWRTTFDLAGYSCRPYAAAHLVEGGFAVAGSATQGDSSFALLVRYSAEENTTQPRSAFLPAVTLYSYPNPFNAVTTISFTLPKTEKINLIVYDLMGRQVETLSDEMLQAGEHAFHFNSSRLPSGIYFARLQSGKSSITQKLLLLK